MTIPNRKTIPVDLATIRARLEAKRGPQYWRCLEEVAATEAFQQFLHREFPEQASEWHDSVSHRRFLQLMGASLALAGLGACSRQPEEKIMPYARVPESIMVPGQPLSFVTAMSLGGVALGVLAESHMGRPTKIEGNPQHPGSLGATDAFAQASLRSLVQDMAAGRVDMLIIIGGNPVYTAPADFEFATHLTNVQFRIHLSYRNLHFLPSPYCELGGGSGNEYVWERLLTG